MSIKEVKKPLTYREQANLLISRGCDVGDEDVAVKILEQINYYRLTAYFLPFKNADDTYKQGTNLQTVYQMHEFDRELSYLLFGAVVSLELKLRAQLAYHHAHKYGALGYTDEGNFNKRVHKHDKFLETLTTCVEHNAKHLFVKHHKKVYGGKFPLCVMVELFTLGNLSFFYSDMKWVDKKVIAKQYNTSPQNLSSWFMCLTNLRNNCAHYSRLYNNTFAAIPATPSDFAYTLGRSVFDYILVLKFLSVSNPDWNNSFVVQLEALIEKYQDYIDLAHLGFPQNWLELLKSIPCTTTTAALAHTATEDNRIETAEIT